jgi:hypothetical protein
MKKVLLIISLSLATLCMQAQNDNGGLFRRGEEQNKEVSTKGGPGLPGHGQSGNQNAPIGSGAALLIGFGAAYAMYKKNKK